MIFFCMIEFIWQDTPPPNFFFIFEMTHSSGLGVFLDAGPLKKMPYVTKKVVGGIFRNLKLVFFWKIQLNFLFTECP